MKTTTERPSAIGRRQALGLAVGAGVAAVTIGAEPAGATDPVEEVPLSPGHLAAPARVMVAGAAVDAEPLDPVDEPGVPWTDVPVAGFPWGLAPRVGDHVAITNDFLDLPLAAVPLCSWVDAVPVVSEEGYVLGARRTVATEAILGDPAGALATAASGGRVVSVCLADTDLGTSLVLQVRTPGSPPATPGA